MPITMRDVARKADVSIKTVSRVVNGQDEISAETRQRILTVIQELGYRPNLVARGLVTHRTHTVGLMVSDIMNPFFAEVARGIQDAARQQGYNVFCCNTDNDPVEELRTFHSLAGYGVDGIISFLSFATGNNLATFAQHFRPIVVINHPFEHPNVSVIQTDNYQGARLAVDYLVAKGHREIGMLAGLETSPLRGKRVHGFQDGLRACGLPVRADRILSGPQIHEAGYENALRLLTQHPQISAIFAYNDLVASGVIRACRQLKRRIPEDCAVVGFDDSQFAALVTPSLTTVRLDKFRIGQIAMRRLCEMLEQPTVHFPTIQLGVELVIRESA